MKKQDILLECGRRVGSTDSEFLSGTLSPAFDWVLRELAQQEAIAFLRQQSSFALNVAGCASANGILTIALAAATVLNLSTGHTPNRIFNLIVPAYGEPYAILQKTDDVTFNTLWVRHGTSYSGRPQIWRIFPGPATVQVWPTPSSDYNTATCFLEWEGDPTTLQMADNITEIQDADLPTVLAGLYRYGIVFQDETLNDRALAESRWLQGVQFMKQRRIQQQTRDRDYRMGYKDW